MVSEREEAKQSVVVSQKTDPELREALGSAHQFQIELVKEQHRHAEAQTKARLGWFGRLLGGEANAPIVIAAIAAFSSFVFAGSCLLLAYFDPENNTLYSDWSGRAFAIAATALGFIFGNRTS